MDSVDEKTALQALDRLDPLLPLSPGRAERHGFEYKRNGTLSLYAALNVATGEVEGMTAAQHTGAQFLRFLDRVIATQSPRREIHLIADNLSAHKMKAVAEWLVAHPRVTQARPQSTRSLPTDRLLEQRRLEQPRHEGAGAGRLEETEVFRRERNREDWLTARYLSRLT